MTIDVVLGQTHERKAASTLVSVFVLELSLQEELERTLAAAVELSTILYFWVVLRSDGQVGGLIVSGEGCACISTWDLLAIIIISAHRRRVVVFNLEVAFGTGTGAFI
jgi:hypothetical protein